MAMLEVDGWVWCDKHQECHSDTLNPNGYVENRPGVDYCLPHQHHKLFYSNPALNDVVVPTPTPGSVLREDVPMSSPKGEYSGVEAEQYLDEVVRTRSSKVKPEPVRSNPTPLTVRRHTEESRAIWKANLLDALPQDMLVEDRSKIADALLETTIKLGNELRRKRLIDKLLNAAEELEDKADSTMRIKEFRSEQLREWSDLLMDAAEEIRSVL